jgi:phosphopantothenoylcysteine synthetase/decarboxylase
MVSKTEQSFRGKRILVVGGSPKETIDGVRHFANHRRDQSHGARMADGLADLGAIVTLVTVQSSEMYHPTVSSIIDTVDGRKIVSTKDLLDACAKLNSIQYDAAVQLANIPSIVPAEQSDHIKVKTDENDLVSLDVVGNVSAIMRLRWMFPKSAVFGYDNRQQWFAVGDGALAHCAREIAEARIENATARQNLITRPDGGECRALAGRKVVITSGSTAEPITACGDVIANLSSGRQGHAVAAALATMGAEVVMVAGHSHIAAPASENIRTINVSSSGEMHRAVTAELGADVFVGVAAVADFAVEHPLELPPKEGQGHVLELRRNPDILRAVGTHTSFRPSVAVVFAAEAHDVLQYAREILNQNGGDLICVNQVGDAMAACSSSVNSITLVTPSGYEELSDMSMLEVGKMIGGKIAQLLTQASSA